MGKLKFLDSFQRFQPFRCCHLVWLHGFWDHSTVSPSSPGLVYRHCQLIYLWSNNHVTHGRRTQWPVVQTYTSTHNSFAVSSAFWRLLLCWKGWFQFFFFNGTSLFLTVSGMWIHWILIVVWLFCRRIQVLLLLSSAVAIHHAYSCPAELQTSVDDIVFTFNCNTPSLNGLVDREYMCTLFNHNPTALRGTKRHTDIPQVVRVNASLVIHAATSI